MHKAWLQKEIELLENNYLTMGLSWCSRQLERTKSSINHKAGKLFLRSKPSKKWTQEELNILRQNYPSGGVDECSINRTRQAISAKARKLSIHCNSYTHPKTKDRLKNGISFECKEHGKVDFYIRPTKYKTPQCKICILNDSRKRYYKNHKDPLYQYINRIRSSFNRLLRNRGFQNSLKLSYSSKKLHNYLETIKKKQKNKCPMCGISYSLIKHDIDHIIPICTAKTINDIQKLFELKNLSILCWHCN